MTRPTDSIEDKANTLGGPMPGVEVKIVHPETGQTVELGTLGEYCTRGYHVMHEYFEMAEATAKTIDTEGWLHTGDLCPMDERGYCKVEGRLKDSLFAYLREHLSPLSPMDITLGQHERVLAT